MTERLRLQRERAEAAGQGHVLRYYDELSTLHRNDLLAQLERVDYDLLARLAEKFDERAAPAADFAPPEVFPLRRDAGEERRAAEAVQAGDALFAAGKVGYLLVAGGQASRLGYSGPKGAFSVGPVSGRTLFEIHARRLRAAMQRYGVGGPWYVMTSPANDGETRAFFSEHRFFGLDPATVTFFAQAMLPALDPAGKIMMADKHRLFLAPNGHGGALAAFADAGLIDHAREHGVEQLSYFQVDNPLARPADPLFLGLHAQAGAGMSSKVVAKRDENEKVGVLGMRDGVLGCIEYSDLPDDLRTQRDDAGELAYRAGNIAVHALSIDFVDEVTKGGLQLPWHVARKRMNVLGDDGRMVERDGAKFETFVFDALGMSNASVTLEVDRAEEFSPVKNREGEDSPHSARRDLCSMWGAWIQENGGSLPAGKDGEPPRVEIDPLLAETREEFAAKWPVEPDVRDVGHLYE